MAQYSSKSVAWILLMVFTVVAADTPPGIAKNPSHATCKIAKYKHCYNLEHVCPKFCPDSCTVECASCKPICGSGSPTPELPAQDGGSKSSGDDKDHGRDKGDDDDKDGEDKGNGNGKGNNGKDKGYGDDKENDNGKGNEKGKDEGNNTPSYPPPTTPTPTPTPPITKPPPTTPTPTPPSTTPSYPPPTTPTPTPPSTTPSYPPPTTPTPTPSTPPSVPTPTPPSVPNTPSQTPPTSTPSDNSISGAKRVRCKNKYYPQCYGVEHTCPSDCPRGCDVDCVTCKPVCSCDKPGAVCQDPRFIGADGLTFYFHGKKDKDFCLVADRNLHINAHFIGRRNENMKRDFTWVQSIGILFDDHKLFVGAQKTGKWDESVDHLAIDFDGKLITLEDREGAKWESETGPATSITRKSDTNSVEIQVEGLFKITASVVPITKKESRIHNYGITDDDCFAHLELGFMFFAMSGDVNGVLGQTYANNYVSRAKMGVAMPVLGGHKEFSASNIFAADCSVTKFQPGKLKLKASSIGMELPSMNCLSGVEGRGVVCKR
ncbi:hypothetical protein LIER_14537 [Lithospermum erythrorhizon]|uniref:Root cap n=1 Tax=Lithospermum erythrorhizon TaxID=34254 RepID=A0AAV3Q129_LITER